MGNYLLVSESLYTYVTDLRRGAALINLYIFLKMIK